MKVIKQSTAFVLESLTPQKRSPRAESSVETHHCVVEEIWKATGVVDRKEQMETGFTENNLPFDPLKKSNTNDQF